MKKKLLSFTCMILSAVMIVGATQTLRATSIEEEQNKQKELKEEIENAQQILKELEALKSDTTAYISALDDKMSELTDYIVNLNTQISDKQDSIHVINSQLKAQEKEIELQYDAMKKRIKFLYENGQSEYLDMILNSGNISELLNKAEYLSKITEYDRDMLNKLKETKEGIELTKATLESEKEELRALKVQAEEEQEEVVTLADAKAQLLRETNEKIDSTQSDVETMEGELSASEEIEAELIELERKREEQKRLEEQRRLEEERQKEEERRLEEERKEEESRREEESRKQEENKETGNSSDSTQKDNDSSNGNSGSSGTNSNGTDGSGNKSGSSDSSNQNDDDNTTTNSGTFSWPLPGYTYISSGFIHRINPVTGKAENHSGIDIPAPAGTPVHAAGGGTVAWAYRSQSAGNWVGIDHGNGLYTVYMHMSGFNCSEGDVVKEGDIIGYVGSTGQSTGNHLHFSVRLNGSYVNPNNYLR